jgi:hypothetical protein
MIRGKKGIGKSSIADYFIDIAENEFNMLGVHVYNDGVNNIETLIQHTIDRILNEIKRESWSKKIFDKLKKHVKSVGVFGTKIEFEGDRETMDYIKNNYAFFLESLIADFENGKGLLITIDDINGLSNTPDFANWYKSFADTISSQFKGNIPLIFILTTYPEIALTLHNQNPSFSRVFKHIVLEGLNDNEIEDFFTKTFAKKNIKVDSDAMDLMVRFSSGLPNMMQEIGNNIFWINNDEKVDVEDSLKGIIMAGENIGIKYLQPVLDESIRSEKYLNILNILSQDFSNFGLDKDYTFKKADFLKKLKKEEANVFSDFLKRARNLNIIEHANGKKGAYQFTNNLYPIYFKIQSLKKETQIKI